MRLFTRLRNQSGQGMTEYIIIIAFIVVATIAAFIYFGKTNRGLDSAMTDERSGQPGTATQKTLPR